MSLFAELKRRKVFRVAVVYGATVFAVLQAADIMLPRMGIPDWGMSLVIALSILGFPVAIGLAWAFDLSPEGLRVTPPRRPVDVTDGAATPLLGKRTVAVAGLLVILGIGIGAGWLLKPATQAAAVVEATKTVAVLPFVPMNAGPDDGYFADGLTEEILNSLSALPDLLVTARTSSFHFKGRDIPVPEIAAVLGVEHIVEGSVRRSGNRLRVTAQLIRAHDGFHLWSDTYDRELADVFAVQLDIAQRIAEALEVALDQRSRRRMQDAGVRNIDAFIAYQKGYALYDDAHDDLSTRNEVLARANEEFERAIERAPELWLAYLFHSDLHLHRLSDAAAGRPDADTTPAALADARRRVAADLDSALRHAPASQRPVVDYMRILFSDDWTGLARASDDAYAAVRCMPNIYLDLAATFGRAEAALRFYERQVECNPLAGDSWGGMVAMPLLMRDYEGTLEIVRRSRSRIGSNQWTTGSSMLAHLARGEIDRAEADLHDAALPEPMRAFFNVAFVAMTGDRNAAARASAEALSYGVNDVNAVVYAAWRGDRAEANAIAARIDARESGPRTLMRALADCQCGAAFDLDATPRLRALIGQSGFTWPPPPALPWPLKDW